MSIIVGSWAQDIVVLRGSGASWNRVADALEQDAVLRSHVDRRGHMMLAARIRSNDADATIEHAMSHGDANRVLTAQRRAAAGG